MTRITAALTTGLFLALVVAGCGIVGGGDATAPSPAPTALDSALTPAGSPTPAPASDPTEPIRATRSGANYVLLLPRETDVPVGWLMNPLPDYEIREPIPGSTYRFACLELPARSIGAASVGYRSLEGMPNVVIEYVIYRTSEDAAAALDDMRRATESCASFLIGAGENAISAGFSPLEFPEYGEGTVSAALATSGPITGDLLTHMVKIRQGHIIIGIAHAVIAGEGDPDKALTESLAALAVENLRNGPTPPAN